jgi:hypothetical protein
MWNFKGGVMKGKCELCGGIYDITSSPNKIEGYFVNQEVWDARQTDFLNEVLEEDGNEKVYCHKCPYCGNIFKIEVL